MANYISQLYVTIISIIIVPLYIKYMGAEAYGLVGFFAMLQTLFMLLDMGLTPTIARETARFRGGATDGTSYRHLVQSLEGIFFIVGLIGSGIMFLASDFIAYNWLNSNHLPPQEIETSIKLITIIIGVRWLCGLYRGIITGSEELIWLGSFAAFIASFRFLGVLPVLIFINPSPTSFFYYQLFIAISELLILLIKGHSLLPNILNNKSSWSLKPIKKILKFSVSIAFTTSVWILITQTDKIVLSKILPLADYGYFTLSVLLASGIMLISNPISGAIIPRMIRLDAENNHDGLIKVYRQGTQLVSIIAGATSITLALYSQKVLWSWTGNVDIAEHGKYTLTLYSIGYGLLAVSAFPGYLQNAKGDLKLHVIGNAIFVIILIPSIIIMANQYGAIGAGYVWLTMNITYLILWVPLVHNRFAKGLNIKWFTTDVLIIFLAEGLTGYLLLLLIPITTNRLIQFFYIGIVGLLVILSGVLASSSFWERKRLFKENKPLQN